MRPVVWLVQVNWNEKGPSDSDVLNDWHPTASGRADAQYIARDAAQS